MALGETAVTLTRHTGWVGVNVLLRLVAGVVGVRQRRQDGVGSGDWAR